MHPNRRSQRKRNSIDVPHGGRGVKDCGQGGSNPICDNLREKSGGNCGKARENCDGVSGPPEASGSNASGQAADGFALCRTTQATGVAIAGAGPQYATAPNGFC